MSLICLGNRRETLVFARLPAVHLYEAVTTLEKWPNAISLTPQETGLLSNDTRTMTSRTDTMTVTVNDQSVTVPADCTIAMLVDHLSLRGGPVAVEWNRQLVPAKQHPTSRLCTGDQLEIVSLTGGG